jgi:hypothetical protein
MGLLDFLRTSPSYHANRVVVKRWLLQVQSPDFDQLEELPFADLDIDYDLRESSDSDDDDEEEEVEVPNQPSQNFPGLAARRMSGKFDYSGSSVQYSTWDNPFELASEQTPYNATYDANPGKIRTDGPYSRALPVVHTTIFHIPGIEEESLSEDVSEDESSDEEG